MSTRFVVSTRQSRLNVRRGPGTQFAVTGALPKGAEVIVVESEGDWRKLDTGGWVHGGYLRPAGAAAAQPGRPFNLGGPPPKDSQPTPQNVRRLEAWLTSLIAGHAGAVNTYTFYEEVDDYLGPWGEGGYPIGYGKKYNVLFSTNKKLNSDPVTRKWVWRTGILLQELLRDYIVERYRAGTLGSLTEPELRQAAFDSHPKAYTQAGLTLVVLTAPEMIDTISSIPEAEFDERSPNYEASKKQVWETIGIVAPETIGTVLATLAGPAHTGSWKRAIEEDRRRFMRLQQLGRWLHETKQAVTSGHVDRVAWLKEIIRKLNQTQFPDQGLAGEARKVVQAAQARICVVVHRYREDIRSGREMREVYDRLDPGWSDIECRQ